MAWQQGGRNTHGGRLPSALGLLRCSWASRRVGQPGSPPRDIDVIVVGDPSRTDLLDVADAAQQQLHTEVNIRTVTPKEWATKDQPFLMTVASRPLITLVDPKAASD